MTPDTLRQYENGIAFCKSSHGTLADRWQEIGRQQCEATHRAIAETAAEVERYVCLKRHGRIREDGRTQGALLGLGVAMLLAVVAGWMGHFRGQK